MTEVTQEKVKVEQEHLLRKSLLESITEKYTVLFQDIQKLPINTQFVIDGLKKMDFGMLWIKEAIHYAPLAFPVPAETEATATVN